MINNTAGASSSSPPPPPLLQGLLPAGYRFKPSDQEIMQHLFHKINTGVALMPEIKDIDLYQCDPQTLASKYAPMGANEWYFFTPTHRKHPNGKRPDRLAGNGFWRAMTADTEVVMHGGQTVGRKLTLVYYTGKNKHGKRTSWLMHEYKVDGVVNVRTHANHMMLAKWVLCKIYENTRKVKANKRQKTEAIARAPAAGYEEFNDGDEDEDDHSRALTNHQLQGFQHHHPQFPNQTMLLNQAAAAAAELNNGYEDEDYSRALTNQRQGFLHQPQFPNQTMLLNPTAGAAEFNNGGTSSECMMMAGQHNHHHNPTFDPTINPIYRLAGAGAEEFHNGGEGCSTMAGGNDMGAMFNPQNYYNPYLDQASLFNTAYADHQAEGSHRVDKGKASSSHHPNLEYQSSLPSSSASAQAQGGSEGLDNGSRKATTSNDQECHCPAPPLDQIPTDENINNDSINVGSNIEGFSMNGRGHCMINGERVEMGEDFMRTSMAAAAPSPSNYNTTDFPNFDYCSFFDIDFTNFTDS